MVRRGHPLLTEIAHHINRDMVAALTTISGQKPETEKRRESEARPPVIIVPVSMHEMALKWKSGSGLHTTSSGVRPQEEMICLAMDRW